MKQQSKLRFVPMDDQTFNTSHDRIEELERQRTALYNAARAYLDSPTTANRQVA